MLRLTLFLAAAVVASAAVKTEIGTLNGAAYRIDIPEKWNGGLVVYCHGYNPKPVTYKEEPPNALMQAFLDRGYAVAMSGYSAGGWAIEEALTDIENVRRYFVSRHGPVKETWITGHSMGGFLTMAVLERQPTVYKGGLPLCGPLAAPAVFMARGLFDFLVLYEYFFPGILPPITEALPDLNAKEFTAKIQAAMDAAPHKAEQFRRTANGGNLTTEEIARDVVFGLGLLAELKQRAGGFPFDNRNILYSGSDDDNTLNDKVKRYAADPAASKYLRTYYTPTGRIHQPMLAIHTTRDQLVPAWMPNTYASLAEQAGASDLFVQQWVKRTGHCTMTPAEVGQGFDELRSWVEKGKRPSAGDRTIPAAQ
jgi:pimeloyl-ACP methyl ester carboxylesterase